jgi:hypothetical protein
MASPTDRSSAPSSAGIPLPEAVKLRRSSRLHKIRPEPWHYGNAGGQAGVAARHGAQRRAHPRFRKRSVARPPTALETRPTAPPHAPWRSPGARSRSSSSSSARSSTRRCRNESLRTSAVAHRSGASSSASCRDPARCTRRSSALDRNLLGLAVAVSSQRGLPPAGIFAPRKASGLAYRAPWDKMPGASRACCASSSCSPRSPA